MTTKTQLAKIAKRLTVQQAVLAYLADIMRRFNSFESWSVWAIGTKGEAPLSRATKAAEEAVRSAARGQGRDAAALAGEAAVRDAVLLIHLFLDVSRCLRAEAAGYDLTASLCAREIQVLLLQQVLGEESRRVRDFLMGRSVVTATHRKPAAELIDRLRAYATDESAEGMPGVPGGTAIAGQAPQTRSEMGTGLSRDRIESVRQRIEDHLAKVYLRRATIAAIRRNYFADRPILFRREAECLEATVYTAEAVAEEYNESVQARASHRRKRFRHPTAGEDAGSGDEFGIDLRAAERRALSEVRDEVALMVRLAKSIALMSLGRAEAACNLATETYRNR
jgi:hypothetical protein